MNLWVIVRGGGLAVSISQLRNFHTPWRSNIFLPPSLETETG